jgi:hypothetical protein
LSGALFLNALLGVSTDKCHRFFFNLSKASVGLSTLGEIDGGLASLGWEAKSPARRLGSTLLFAILDGGHAL